MRYLDKIGILNQSYLSRLWARLKLPIAGLASSLAQILRAYHTRTIRRSLPKDILEWRTECAGQQYHLLWDSLRPLFSREGYTLWAHDEENDLGRQVMSTTSAPGYWFQNPCEAYKGDVQYFPTNGRQHALRGWDGKDYIATVTSMAGSNENHLRILRRLSHTKPDILSPNNHILPIVQEIFLEDVLFTIFPLVRADLELAIFPCPETSVEDLLHMVMQIFEATKYIHSKNIAHRDLFMENFVIEWVPQSIKSPCWMRPRVYLIDFETAVEFALDADSSERVCHTLPFPEDVYKRPRPRELSTAPFSYCPFRLDMWQLGYSLAEVLSGTGIASVDTMWAPLWAENPEDRLTAEVAYDNLRNLLISAPLEQFLVPSAKS